MLGVTEPNSTNEVFPIKFYKKYMFWNIRWKNSAAWNFDSKLFMAL